MPRATNRQASTQKPAGMVSINEAAQRVGCSYETMRLRVSKGVFTVVRPLGVGRGKQAYLFDDEVEAFTKGQEPAVQELRRLREKATRKR